MYTRLMHFSTKMFCPLLRYFGIHVTKMKIPIGIGHLIQVFPKVTLVSCAHFDSKRKFFYPHLFASILVYMAMTNNLPKKDPPTIRKQSLINVNF